MSTVIAPVGGYSGTVAGVRFEDGRAETDDPQALAYFRCKGYTIDGDRREPPPEPERIDPRNVGEDGSGRSTVGLPLRDAAVDPRPGDRPVFPVRRGPDGVPRRTPPDDAA